MSPLQKGQRYRATGTWIHATSTVEVLHVERAKDLPPIDGAPDVATVHALMLERGITHLALIGWRQESRDVSCILLVDAAGATWDLHGQPVTLTPLWNSDTPATPQ